VFELILFLAVIISGVILLVYKFILPKGKEDDAVPVPLDYARSFFPVLFSYGVKLPILHTEVIDLGDPVRGDVVVFRWPGDNKTSYIKRLVGVPGDKIEYRNRQLYVNGQVVKTEHVGSYIPAGKSLADDRFLQTIATSEKSDGQEKMVQYSTLLSKPTGLNSNRSQSWIVPDGHYFMMGDNRDNSADSRAWGFLPDENVVGKAFFVWFHLNTQEGGDGLELSRIGTNIEAKSVK